MLRINAALSAQSAAAGTSASYTLELLWVAGSFVAGGVGTVGDG